MHLVKGDLWNETLTADLILFPGNSNVDRFGALVMGAGCALEAKERWPWLPKKIGADLRAQKKTSGEYLLWIPEEWDEPGARVGVLQTKKLWFVPSNLPLIARSLTRLQETLAARPEITRVALAMPGVGCGGLRREDVLPLLLPLPDTCYVYER